MNSIETGFTGVLQKEKKKLYDFTRKSASSIKAKEKHDTEESYFVPYKDSKHLDSALCVYDSDRVLDFKEALLELWEDDAKKRDIVPIVLAADYRSRKEHKKQIPEIDMVNYMF